MNLTQGFKMAMKSLNSNKLRSFLTMLGIIIGVSAVIALVSLGQGATNQVTEQVQSLGSNLLTINISGRGTIKGISLDEAMALGDKLGVKAVAPVVSSQVKAKNGSKNVDVSLEGTTAEYQTVREYKLQEGRFILPIDVQYGQKVAVIGAQTAKDLFGNISPVGQTISINGTKFKVVGLLAVKGSSMSGSNDEKILIPFVTAGRLLASKNVRTIYIQAKSSEEIDTAIEQIESTLKKKFRNDTDSYKVFNQADMLSAVNSITGTLTIALAGIAGISLLVGGIGIMNIMLVSVTERTREIGIRKAIGAKKRDILFQFLIESMVLSGLGGALGILIGGGGAMLLANAIGISVTLSTAVVLVAFGFSVCVGIFFGIVPANKAAKLKPIDALRVD